MFRKCRVIMKRLYFCRWRLFSFGGRLPYAPRNARPQKQRGDNLIGGMPLPVHQARRHQKDKGNAQPQPRLPPPQNKARRRRSRKGRVPRRKVAVTGPYLHFLAQFGKRDSHSHRQNGAPPKSERVRPNGKRRAAFRVFAPLVQTKRFLQNKGHENGVDGIACFVGKDKQDIVEVGGCQ